MNVSKAMGSSAQEIFSGSDTCLSSNDATIFSSSLPVLPHAKCMKLFTLKFEFCGIYIFTNTYSFVLYSPM